VHCPGKVASQLVLLLDSSPARFAPEQSTEGTHVLFPAWNVHTETDALAGMVTAWHAFCRTVIAGKYL
jgi:hypothetical protein